MIPQELAQAKMANDRHCTNEEEVRGRVWWGLCEGEDVVGIRVRGRVWWGLCEGEGVVGPRVRGRVW